MFKYVLIYFLLFLCLVTVQRFPGGQNATALTGNTCMHATDCVVTSYLPLTITRAGEEVENTLTRFEVLVMLAAIGLFGLFTGFVHTDISFWRPMPFVMLGTFVALLPGVNTIPMGSLLIPYIPLELWVGFLGAAVCFFCGAFRLIPIGFLLGYFFSKLALMSDGEPLFQLYTAGILLVIADQVIGGLLQGQKERVALATNEASIPDEPVQADGDIEHTMEEEAVKVDGDVELLAEEELDGVEDDIKPPIEEGDVMVDGDIEPDDATDPTEERVGKKQSDQASD